MLRVAVKTFAPLVLGAGLLLGATACASDSGAGTAAPVLSYPPVEDSTLTSLQFDVINNTYQLATASGVALDAACLKSVLAQLPDADARLILAAKAGDTPTLSAKGSSLAPAVKACITPATTVGVTTG